MNIEGKEITKSLNYVSRFKTQPRLTTEGH